MAKNFEEFKNCIFQVEYERHAPGSEKRELSINVLETDAIAALQKVERRLKKSPGKDEIRMMGAKLLARADI